VVLYEIYSKKLQLPNTFGTSLYIQKCIKKEPNEVSKEHWKIKIYFSVLFLRTWRSGILFQPNITIFDIYMKK
jgi:hypothetical protein